jgi:hypothetical protein
MRLNAVHHFFVSFCSLMIDALVTKMHLSRKVTSVACSLLNKSKLLIMFIYHIK